MSETPSERSQEDELLAENHFDYQNAKPNRFAAMAEENGAILYETDFLQWIETTVEKLRHQDYAQVDWENLIDEIESMGRSERQSLKSNLIVVLLHLLKWRYQPDRRSTLR